MRRTREETHFANAVALEEVQELQHFLVACILVGGDYHRAFGDHLLRLGAVARLALGLLTQCVELALLAFA